MLTIRQIIADLNRAINARAANIENLDGDEYIYTERDHALEELGLLEIIRDGILEKMDHKTAEERTSGNME